MMIWSPTTCLTLVLICTFNLQLYEISNVRYQSFGQNITLILQSRMANILQVYLFSVYLYTDVAYTTSNEVICMHAVDYIYTTMLARLYEMLQLNNIGFRDLILCFMIEF